MKPLSTLVLCFFFLLSSAQKNNTIDSIEKRLSSQRDSILVGSYNELTWQYRMVDKDKAISYGNKAIDLGRKVRYLKGVAQAYNDLGIIYYDKENYDSAISLYFQSMKIRQQLKDELGVAKLYNKIGIVYQKEGKFDKALDNQLKALDLFKKSGNDIGISYSLNNIGVLNQNLGRYDEAIKYQEQSIAIKEKIGDKIGLAGSYVNVANIYSLQNNTKKAEEFYQQAIAIARPLNDKEYLSNALNNLGSLYQKTSQYNKAIEAVEESLNLRTVLKDSKGRASCLNNLGDIYFQLKKYDSAALHLKAGIDIAKGAVNCAPELNKLNLSLSKLYEQIGNPVEALQAYKEYSNSKDTLFTSELNQNFAQLEAKYNTLEKENEIEQQQFQITKRNYWLIAISATLVLITLLAISYYRRIQLKQRNKLQQEILKHQQLSTQAVIEAEENERKRIAKDLHDSVGQMMSAAKMNLSAIENELQFIDPLQRIAFHKVIALVDESCKEVRNVSYNMMPNALLKSGLALAVREFIDKIDSRVIKVDLYTEGLNERIDANTEMVLYRVIQECVNNVIKHSGATHLDISLVKDSSGISATIEDNGKGFDTTDASKYAGLGLKNIQTRIEYLKGTVEFNASEGRGTLVAMNVPVNKTLLYSTAL